MAVGWNRRGFLEVLGAVTVGSALPVWGQGAMSAGAVSAGAGAAGKRPNIVVILADDMGYSDVGCYGSEIATPNINALAKRGVRFTQCYNTARCCPSRASLLTGLYAHQAGVGHMVEDDGLPGYRGKLNDKCVTIAEVLKAAGYQTFMAGKWHIGEGKGHLPRDRGFERFYGIPQGGSNYFKPQKGRTLMLDDDAVAPFAGWYATNAYADYAVKFLDEAKGKDAPFFLYAAFTAPHWPLQALPEDIAKYKDKYAMGWDEVREKRHQRQIEMGLVEKAWELSPRGDGAWEKLTAEEKAEKAGRMAVYAAQVDRLDQNIGRILAKIKEMGAEDNTMVVFLSDNGGCAEVVEQGEKGAVLGTKESFCSYGLPWANASNTPFRMYKHFVHEGGIATPLIVRWPAGLGAGGTISREVVHEMDLMATACAVSGAKYPEKFGGKEITPLEGVSLLPVLEGKKWAGHAYLCWEHEGNRALRQGKWKIVEKHGSNKGWELYDLETDRTELVNLAEKEPEKVKELAGLYEAWAKRCGVVAWPVKKGAGGGE